ncbi:SseB family protein [Micromonospora sp. NRRL B-16802]|uniref:SseB family protein n=1 Tax=Micromonospora sp. NRRL B-16802 TaxID=1415541 RepID=UPI0006AF8BF7|nr:SseB family protein [Micromonospora sp. NRRL B-16802]
MTEWEPATEAEVAMREALRANDQELYFRLLSRTDLLLPVSAPTPPGQPPSGWGTWTTGGRTHVLAFTSSAALRACLGEHTAGTRRVPFADLALAWPNHEWWLAVNPGLPVEGYLPAWFVSQLSRGDVRLPGRAMGARARLERAETLARSRAGTTSREAAPGTGPAATSSGRPSPTTAVPPVGGPTAPNPTPGAAGLSRGSGVDDMPAAGQRHPTGPPRPARSDAGASRYAALAPPDRPAPVPTDAAGAGWPPASRPAADTDDPAATNGAAPDGRRSFFEPTSGRSRPSGTTPGDVRPGDRAVPPSRFARGSQPFPRRRPADDGPTRAFPMPPPAAADLGAPRGVRAPSANEEATQPLPPRRPDPLAHEPTRAFRVPGTATGAPAPNPAGRPSEDETQAIPHGRPIDPRQFEPAEEIPPSVAEPVSGPPGSRRGFTPIVIEGTIIESRDLTDTAEADARVEAASRPGPPSAPPPFDKPDAPVFGAAAPDAPAPDPAPFGAPAPDPAPFGASAPGPAPFGTSAPDPAPFGASAPGPAPSGTSASDPAPFGTPAPEPAPPVRPASSEPSLFEPAAARRMSAPADAGPDVVGERPVDAAAGGWRADERAGTSVVDERAGFGASPVDVNGADRISADWIGADRTGADDRATPVGEDVGGPLPPIAPDVNGSPSPAAAGFGESSSPAAAGVGDSSSPAAAGVGDSPSPLAAEVGGHPFPVGTSSYPVDSGVETARLDVTTPDSGTLPVADGQRPPAETPAPVEFEPANTVEEDLLSAAGSGSTDTFLSTLLLARVLLPAAPDSARGSRPGDPGFVWRTAQLDGETYVVVYTSPERLADHTEGDVDTVRVKFAQLIRRWPDEDWSFAVNPGTPVGAKLPGEQIVALANWAAEVGLGDDLEVDPQEPAAVEEPAARPRYAPAAVDPTRPTVMQKAIAPSQLAYYLERGYDRVSGFVHRAGELAHLTTPAELHDALGLSYPGSPFVRDAEEIYVLRWPAHRPSLYRIPYGGQNEAAMRAMEGWVIERPPFRGNGFAPGESSDVVAEFKVDSVRLPHGAQLWRIGGDGTERVVAVLDTDAVVWRRVGEA